MKILIAIPSMDTLPYQFVNSILALKGKTNVHLQTNSLVYDSRNLISLNAISNGFDYVMWFDSDMMFTPDAMNILVSDAIRLNAEMVTGLYFKRRPPYSPVIHEVLEEPTENEEGKLVANVREYFDYPENAIFPVKGCGFGCVLTSVRLLKEVWDKFGPAFGPYPWGGEDISFCHRVNKLGYTIYCDSNVTCGHIGTFVYTEEFYKTHREVKRIEREQANEDV